MTLHETAKAMCNRQVLNYTDKDNNEYSVIVDNILPGGMVIIHQLDSDKFEFCKPDDLSYDSIPF